MMTLFKGFKLSIIVTNIWAFIAILVLFDVVTGLLASAKERKLNSSITFNGFLKKIAEFIGLAFVSVLDAYFDAHGLIIKTAVTILIAYEGFSIVENLSRVGVNFNFVTKYFDPNKIGKGGNQQ